MRFTKLDAKSPQNRILMKTANMSDPVADSTSQTSPTDILPDMSSLDLADQSVKEMVDLAASWNLSNQLDPVSVVRFIRLLVFNAFQLLASKSGQEKKRIVLAVVNYSVAAKTDWTVEQKRKTLAIIAELGSIWVDMSSSDLKDFALQLFSQISETVQACKTVFGCCAPSHPTGQTGPTGPTGPDGPDGRLDRSMLDADLVMQARRRGLLL